MGKDLIEKPKYLDYDTIKLNGDLAAIEGKVYYLRKFSAKHPGGLDILLYVGRNATPHFHMHHPHMSPQVLHNHLKDYYIAEYKETGEDCGDRYYYNSPFAIELLNATRPYCKEHYTYGTWWSFTKVGIILTWFFTSLFYYLTAPSYFGSISYAFSFYCVALCVMHTANHGGFSSSPWVNRYLGYTMNILGTDRVWWMLGHNVDHHAFVSDYHCDRDESNVEPMMKTSPHSHVEHYPWYKKSQVFWFLLAITFYPYVQTFDKSGWTLKRHKHNPKNLLIDNEMWLLWGSKLWTFFQWYYMFSTQPFWQAIQYHLIATYLFSFLIVCPFELSHHFEGNPKVTGVKSEKRDWYKEQIEASCDYGGVLANTLSGGLSCQIVHHLFPRMDHDHYPALREIIKEVCRKHGVVYKHFNSIFDNVRSTVNYIHYMEKSEQKA